LLVGIPFLFLQLGIGHRAMRMSPMALRAVGRNWEWVGWTGLLFALILAATTSVMLAWIGESVHLYATGAVSGDAISLGTSIDANVLQKSTDPSALDGIVQPVGIGVGVAWLLALILGSGGINRLSVIPRLMIPITISGALVLTGLLLCDRGFPVANGSLNGLWLRFNPDWSALGETRTWLAAIGWAAGVLVVGTSLMTGFASRLPGRADLRNHGSLMIGLALLLIVLCAAAVATAEGVAARSVWSRVADLPGGAGRTMLSTIPGAILSTDYHPVIQNSMLGVYVAIVFAAGLSLMAAVTHALAMGMQEKFGMSRVRGSLLVALGGSAIGLILSMRGGAVWIEALREWITALGLVPLGILLAIAVGWFSRPERIVNHINATSRSRIGAGWRFLVRFVVPIALAAVVLQAIGRETMETATMPLWMRLVALALLFASLGMATVLSRQRPAMAGPEEE
jgi:NSS family neurotransmitter:Na+ symporter